jgi:hypothetical protein
MTALLSLQFAVAAYACPSSPDTSSVAAAMMPCESMDQSQPKLCEQHCAQAARSVDTQPHSTINVPVVPVMLVAVPSLLALRASARSYDAAHVTVVDPPPLVRFGVLRI